MLVCIPIKVYGQLSVMCRVLAEERIEHISWIVMPSRLTLIIHLARINQRPPNLQAHYCQSYASNTTADANVLSPGRVSYFVSS
jgi:hypothetical protein